MALLQEAVCIQAATGRLRVAQAVAMDKKTAVGKPPAVYTLPPVITTAKQAIA